MDRISKTEPRMAEQRVFVAREHADANLRFERDRYSLKKYHVRWTRTDRYVLGEKVGQGHFGEAFDAVDTMTGRTVVVKTLKKARKEKIKLKKEIRMLEFIRGGPNCVKLLECVKDSNTGKKFLVFEKVDYVPSKQLFPHLSVEEVRYYAYNILRAIHYAHTIGIMHRDVKPSNILIDPRRRRVRLIDWGVAGFYFPREKNIRGPGTRCYKSPELALRYDYYDYGCDMWAFGCTLGSMVFLVHPLIRGKGSWFNQLMATVTVVGSEALFAYMEKLRIQLTHEQIDLLAGHPAKEWDEWIDDSNEDRVTPEALDLISKLVVADHTQRMTAREALEHPYFDSVRRDSDLDPVAANSDDSDDSDDADNSGDGSYTYCYETGYVYYSYTPSSSDSGSKRKAKGKGKATNKAKAKAKAKAKSKGKNRSEKKTKAKAKATKRGKGSKGKRKRKNKQSKRGKGGKSGNTDDRDSAYSPSPSGAAASSTTSSSSS